MPDDMNTAPTHTTILIVDEDGASAELIALTLTRGGLRVRIAKSGLEAIELMSREAFSAVLLSYLLPDGMVWPVLHAAGNTTGLLPVVLMIPEADQDAIADAIRFGAADFVIRSGKYWALLPHVIQRAIHTSKCAAAMAREASVAAASRDAIIGTDINGQISAWNSAATRIFGYGGDAIIGHPFDILAAGTNLNEINLLRSRAAAGEFVENHETVLTRIDGAPLAVLLSLAPVMDGRNRIDSLTVIARDITEKKRLDQRLCQTQRMEAIGNLASGVAHDFNNLLTVINNRCELILNHVPQDSAIRQDTELIQSTAVRAAALTHQLLAFSRQQPPQLKVLDLNSVVRNIDRMLRKMVCDDIGFHTILQPGLKHVKADPSQIEQIIVNLVVNAGDAMPKKGKLTIETADVEVSAGKPRSPGGTVPGHYVMLEVSDTGCGIDPAIKDRIFEPFFTTKDPGRGTGLGLHTVFTIAKQCGGFVEVASQIGKGTSFRVYLPRFRER